MKSLNVNVGIARFASCAYGGSSETSELSENSQKTYVCLKEVMQTQLRSQ